MNRAVMLRMAACGIMGLGAALLIAALLLSTYTSSRITKIPLDLDATLISDGTGQEAGSIRQAVAIAELQYGFPYVVSHRAIETPIKFSGYDS